MISVGPSATKRLSLARRNYRWPGEVAPPTLEIPPERRPRHIAIIMDGNGRWAERQNLPRIAGHERGVDSVRRTTEECDPAQDRAAHALLPVERKLEAAADRDQLPHAPCWNST